MMKKNNKVILVFILALIFAAAAGICVYQFLSPQRTTIYTFKQNYAAGTPVTSDMFTPLQVDADIVIAGAKAPASQRFITVKEFATLLKTNDSLKVDVGEGTPLMMSLLSVTGGNAIEMMMQSTAVAVTVDVNPTTGITGDLTAGSSVNVYVTYHSGGTKLILEKMRILGVSKTGSGSSLNGVTIELTNGEALKLIDATKNGSVYLGLVNAGGYQPVEEIKKGSNVNDLLKK